ncbi:hypothetical protein ABZS29_03165 [Kribbella sp. NPDC005582]|uniref:hypothetical protein n=1 Tax=Kribbella sp. NPDC005582 TaxID=3156893 RepID=UPI0033AF7694
MPKFLILMTETDHDTRWAAAGPAGQEQILDAMGAFASAVRAHGTLHAVLPLLPSTPPSDLHGAYLVDLPDESTSANLTELLPYPCQIREVQDVGIPITS